MFSHDLFIKKIQKEFTRKDLLAVVVKNGYSIQTGDRIIEYGLLIGSIERIKKGHYKKITNQLQEKSISNEFNHDDEGF
ncbi:hypothetical protein [Flavivirga jejuensis]|uniref:Uncharacterized protein n=1 Tax=Flavivirga jejuensis TaxID=870487 RepID=A0ABT8WK44_9FLAO|nr:hypothetical protein [Flavivirga jejuensis]MDO5973528.1 hypothetical protein [Flavivirga jejuensis]